MSMPSGFRIPLTSGCYAVWLQVVRACVLLNFYSICLCTLFTLMYGYIYSEREGEEGEGERMRETILSLQDMTCSLA